MTSWRDSASQQTQDDQDGLLDLTLPFAQQMLAKRGEFYPFGATVTAVGETRSLAGDLGQEHPASADVLLLLAERLRQERADLRAVAICSNVQLSDSDAVRVELEHRAGPHPGKPRESPGPVCRATHHALLLRSLWP